MVTYGFLWDAKGKVGQIFWILIEQRVALFLFLFKHQESVALCVGGWVRGWVVVLPFFFSFFFFPPPSTPPSIVDFQYVYEFYMPMTMQLRVVSTITVLLNIA